MRPMYSPTSKIYKVTSGLLKSGPQSINSSSQQTISSRNLIKVKSSENINKNSQYYQSLSPRQNLGYEYVNDNKSNSINLNNISNSISVNNKSNSINVNNNNKSNTTNTTANNSFNINSNAQQQQNYYQNPASKYGYDNNWLNNSNFNNNIINPISNQKQQHQQQQLYSSKIIQNLGSQSSNIMSKQNSHQSIPFPTQNNLIPPTQHSINSQKSCTYQNQDQYIGQWIQDKIQQKQKPHGYGVYKFIKDKLQYRGYFKNGKFHGIGTLYKIQPKIKPEIIYQGEWIEGDKHGSGKYYYNHNTNTYYQGNWNRNLKQGRGIYSSNQGIYEGYWHNNKKHGKGILKLNNNTIYQGQWNNDQFVQGQLKYPNNDKYQGSFKNYQRHGQGQYIPITRQQQYKGNWVNNLKQGNAQIFYQNGQKYIGQMNNNQRQGNNCIYQWKNGTKIICTFQNNLPVKGRMIQSESKSFEFDMNQIKKR